MPTYITDLSALTTPAAGDLFITTDVSDTTDRAPGTDKYITWARILAGISITESQISNLGTYLTASSTATLTNKSIVASQLTGSIVNARVQQSNVTQHQGALSITESQISNLGTYLTSISGQSIGTLSDVTVTSASSGHTLSWNGSAWVNGAPSGGGDALVANPLSQFAATTSAQLAGVISNETGSGALVFATSPTLITPALGTPGSGVLTNCTGYTGDSALVTSGALNSGSITSGFGTIDTGASTITTTGVVRTGNIEIGHATDTTLARTGAGVLAIEGVEITTNSGTQTLTNKSIVASQLTGSIVNARVQQSNVTQHQAALSITKSQVADLGTVGNAFVANPLSQFAATTSAQLAGVISNETGSGLLVFATSPTLITPALGTPASGVLTNATGYTGDSSLVTSGALNSGSITSGFGTIDNGASTITTTGAVRTGNIEVGHATDTTLARTGAGVLAIEGVEIATISATQTLTNKSIVASQLTGSIVNARVQQSNVTQHQGALSITESQISNLGTYLTASSSATLTNKSIVASQLTGSIVNARVQQSNVTQHQAALSITKSQVADLGTVGNAFVANPLSQFAATTSAQLAGVISNETGSGLLVFGTSPTLITPALGTPGSGVLTNCTGYTGDSSLVTSGALNSGSITSGFGTIDNGASAITTTGDITGGGIHVTADTAASDNAALGYTAAEGLILTGEGSTSDVTLKNDADGTVLSIPTGTTTAAFAGAIEIGHATDTTLARTGSGVLAIEGVEIATISATQTLTNKSIVASQLTGSIVDARVQQSNVTQHQAALSITKSQVADLGTVGNALVANPLSQFAATTSAQLAGVISNETGSGLLVFGTSPTLVTPALGTPGSGVLTNCTGYTGDSSLVTSGALNSGSITSGFGTIDTGASTITTTGDITGGGIHVTGDTAASDNGALGYTAAEGLILTGEGSSSDVTLKNDADGTVLSIPTGTTTAAFAGNITVVGTVDGRDVAADGTAGDNLIDIPFNNQTGTTYTLVLADATKVVECNNGSAIALTVPPNSGVAFAVGAQIVIVQQGAGQITVTPGSGVTLRSASSKLKLTGQYSAATIIKRATNEWYVIGDLAS